MIVELYPPNYEIIRMLFKLTDENVFAYYPHIYNPHKLNLDPSIIVHEETHLEQQKNGVEQWWQRYIADSAFRFAVELEAYQAQYKFLKKKIKDRNKLAKFLNIIANDFASPAYGSICTWQEASEAILSDTKFKI